MESPLRFRSGFSFSEGLRGCRPYWRLVLIFVRVVSWHETRVGAPKGTGSVWLDSIHGSIGDRAVPPLTVQVSEGVLQGLLVDHPAPVYPPEAKENHIQRKGRTRLNDRQDRDYERDAHLPRSGAYGFRCRCRESVALPTIPVERFPGRRSIHGRSQSPFVSCSMRSRSTST